MYLTIYLTIWYNIIVDKLTQKQESFTQDLFAKVNQNKAYANHYNTENMLPATIDRAAFELKENPKVTARLAELNGRVESKLVASVLERKERLSEFIREDIEDKDGEVKRTSNIQAVDALNKMEKVYSEPASGYQDNRTINIIVTDQEAKEMLDRVVKGERTEKLIEGDNVD